MDRDQQPTGDVSESPFTDAFAQHRRYLINIAYRLVGSLSEAEDLVQEGFTRLLRADVDAIDDVRGWLVVVVTRLCLDHLRKKQVRKEDAPVTVDAQGEHYDLLAQVPDGRSGANPERDLMRRELGRRINHALEDLTPRERMVFELKHYQGLKLRTVGEILNTTEETAKNTLFRATQKLRGALADMR